MTLLKTCVFIGMMIGMDYLSSGSLSAQNPDSKTFQANGIKIHYLLAGTGEPVILIHGLHSSAEMNWKLTRIIRDLATDHQVIALDLPGHGQSDKPTDESAYGLQVVEDVILLLGHLKIEKAHVVGYSLGGMVALKLLATHPERFLSGTLGGMGWLQDGSGLQRIWERMPVREGRRTPSAFLNNIGKLAISEEDLKKIQVPVKVIVGDRDPVNRLYVEPLKQARSDWPVVEITDAGHINCIIKQSFREEIGSWIRKNSQSSPE